MMLEHYKLNQEAAVLASDPIVVKPETVLVHGEVFAISPSMGETVQDVLT